VNLPEMNMQPAGATGSTEELQLAQLIVDPEASLYGEGLGLDSIDILEISLAVSQTYNIKLRSDDAKNQQIFRSLRSLSQHIQQFRDK
jgi:acyl carrier protein